MLTTEDCQSFGIPERLHTIGRKKDNNFSPDEKIYRRFPQKDPFNQSNILSDGRISLSVYSTRRMSCIREKYSEEPEDVLYNSVGHDHYFHFGIIEMKVSRVESEIFPHPELSGLNFKCKVLHNSHECMYPHVEVCITDNNEKERKVAPVLKTQIKSYFQKISKIIKHPSQ